jgi:hypothetical protein
MYSIVFNTSIITMLQYISYFEPWRQVGVRGIHACANREINDPLSC